MSHRSVMPNFSLNEQTWRRLDGKITWVALSRYRNSFLSKAVTALSMSSLVLGNMPGILKLAHIEPFSLKLLLGGSLLFLLGYALFGFWSPLEFSQPGELHDQVRHMREISDDQFISSRYGLARNLLDRVHEGQFLPPPEGVVVFLEAKLAEVAQLPKVDVNTAAGMFHADLALRQHTLPGQRIAVAIAMILGAAGLSFSTVRNVLHAIF